MRHGKHKMAMFFRLFFFFMLAASEVVAGSIFDPAKNSKFCPKDYGRVLSGMDVRKYPGELPVSLDQDFSKYREIYQGEIDDYLHAYSDYLMLLMAKATWSPDASVALRKEILKNSIIQPLKYNAKAEGRPTFHILLVMVPLTIAYAQHKHEYSKDEKNLVNKWIERKLRTILQDNYLGSTDTDNKKYFIGVWLAAFAEATGNKSYLNKAISIFKKAVDKQRKDGSLINDSQRGGSAIHYTNQAVMSLVTLAEMLTEAGFNAYDYNKNGRSIHTIINFLLDATIDPTRISGYASDPEWSKSSFPGYSAENQQLKWITNQNAVWAYYYLNRFEKSDLGNKIRSVSPFIRKKQLAVHENAGGNPVCYIGGFP